MKKLNTDNFFGLQPSQESSKTIKRKKICARKSISKHYMSIVEKHTISVSSNNRKRIQETAKLRAQFH